MVRLAETPFRESIGIVGMNVPAMPMFCIALAGIANSRTSSAVGLCTYLCKTRFVQVLRAKPRNTKSRPRGRLDAHFSLAALPQSTFSQASSYDLPRIFHGWRMHAGSFFPAVFLQCFPRQNSRSLHLRLSKPPIDHQAVFPFLSLAESHASFRSFLRGNPSPRRNQGSCRPGPRNCRALPPYFRRTERRRPRFNVPWGTSDANLPISFA